MMNRRELLLSSSALAMSAAAQTPPTSRRAETSYIELRYFYLRNSADNQRQRVTDFLKNSYAPAAQRAGIGPVGVFSSMIAPNTPFILTVRS
ncbi:MAG: hypothetical protein K2Q23_09725, partial [Bryobacteraceae bacterium]|nr:hypothetical protein [Bryobacteraceae bacterium]